LVATPSFQAAAQRVALADARAAESDETARAQAAAHDAQLRYAFSQRPALSKGIAHGH
jgi:hypothetical protein